MLPARDLRHSRLTKAMEVWADDHRRFSQHDTLRGEHSHATDLSVSKNSLYLVRRCYSFRFALMFVSYPNSEFFS